MMRIPRTVRGYTGFVLTLVTVLAGSGDACATPLSDARSRAVAWLESHQTADGSWSTGTTAPLVTAETLLALAKSNRGRSVAGQKATAWLQSREFASIDYRARAIRALEAAGGDASAAAQALAAVAAQATGWGAVDQQGPTSLDSALALAGTLSAGALPTDWATKRDAILARRRSDFGWSGDFVLAAGEPSDRTITAEVARALVGIASPGAIDPSLALLEDATGLAAASTLELAARLAALHAWGRSNAAIETVLVARAQGSAAWGDDPYVNALGLLAITTKPSVTFDGGPQADDDNDGEPNQSDAFPHDPSEQRDLDLDGIGDQADPDRDGDGVCDPGEAAPASVCTGSDPALFASDPTESRDTDGDGLGDSADLDDDGDGAPDVEELARGSDPRSPDTDGDGLGDLVDPCVLVAGGTDADLDGVCTPRDACPDDPTDFVDTDGDGQCDVADADDDSDGVGDLDEIAAGTDPKSAASVSRPADLAGTEDFDRDGIGNAEEVLIGTSPFRIDSDLDGAPDEAEHRALPRTDPLDPASHPPLAIVAVAAAGAATAGDPSATSLASTVTGAQPTPVAAPGTFGAVSRGGAFVNLAGFQPQTGLGRDLDQDGLGWSDEQLRRTSPTNEDTDGDRFVDGAGNAVATSRHPDWWNLDGDDGFIDGELDLGTDPADLASRPGKKGDVAPLGRPDGRITAGDAVVATRLAADPGLLNTLTGQHRQVCEDAADVDADQAITVMDAVRVHRKASTGAE